MAVPDFDLDSLPAIDRLTLLRLATRREAATLRGNVEKAAQLERRITEILTMRGAVRNAEEPLSPHKRSRTPPAATVEQLLRFRRRGLTLAQAASLSGVHVATVCRWQSRYPVLRQAFLDAAAEVRSRREEKETRPSVPWRRDCPLCRARVVVRAAPGQLRFWRCGRWPLCEWASWRPRAERNCRHCKAPCFWSHSRKSIGCSACGVRTKGH